MQTLTMHTAAIFLVLVAQLHAQVQVDTGGVAESFDEPALQAWVPEDWRIAGDEDWNTNIGGADGRLLAAGKLDPAQLKQPLSSTLMWIVDNRKAIHGMVGTNAANVGKKGGEMWKALPDAKKKVYEDRAKKAREQRDAYIAKVKDTPEFKTYMDTRASTKLAARKKKTKRAIGIARRSVAKSDKLKRPPSAYTAWLTENSKSITAKDGAAKFKKAGEMWKALPDGKKKTYEDRADKAKKDYDGYIATRQGAAALKAYEDAVEQALAPIKAKSDATREAAKKAKAQEKVAAAKLKLKERLAAKKARALEATKIKAVASAKREAAAATRAKGKASAAEQTYKKLLRKAASSKAAAARAAASAAGKAGAKAAKSKMTKKLIEIIPNVTSISPIGAMSVFTFFGVALALRQFRGRGPTQARTPLLISQP